MFSGLCSSSVTAALALMTVSTQLLLMDKINFTLNVFNSRTFLNISETKTYVALIGKFF